MFRGLGARALSIIFLFHLCPVTAQAGLFGDFTDPQAAINSLAGPLVRAVGIGADHRPMMPATPLGTSIGVDVGIAVSLVRFPDELKQLFSDLGSNALDSLPVLPVPRILIHKGLGQSIDIGASAMVYVPLKMSLYGGDIKITVYDPDQGITWAIRGSYAYSKIDYVKTDTFSPQILISRKLNFADPYLGMGYQYTTGTVTLPLDLGPPPIPQEVSGTGSGGAFLAFLGVGMVLGPTGIKITLEGSYSSLGAHSLGAKLGLAF